MEIVGSEKYTKYKECGPFIQIHITFAQNTNISKWLFEKTPFPIFEKYFLFCNNIRYCRLYLMRTHVFPLSFLFQIKKKKKEKKKERNILKRIFTATAAYKMIYTYSLLEHRKD